MTESILALEIIEVVILIRNFFRHFTSKIGIRIVYKYSTPNPLFSYEVICITRQKDKVEQLPNLWNMENKSRQNVCLASCITSIDVHHTNTVSVTQLESRAQVSTITIENQLHFFEYFDDKLIYIKKFSFRFCKSSIYSIIFWFFAQMQKDLNEKRSCKYSRPFWILSLTSKSSSFPGLLDHKMLQASWKSIDRVRSCCCKTGEENAIKLLKYISQQQNNIYIKWISCYLN